MLASSDGQYRGIVISSEAFDPALDVESPAKDIAHLTQTTLLPTDTLPAILERFERLQVDDIAVVSEHGKIMGVLTQNYVRRRYAQELEKLQAHLFGER
jgi:CIC family chloride channel protein